MKDPIANARDLKKGQRVLVGNDSATVLAVSYCDGHNGEPPRLFGAINSTTKTAAALRIELEAIEPLYVHPAQQIRLAGS